MCCTVQGLFVNTMWLWNLERRLQILHLTVMHSASTATWYIMELNHADSGQVILVFINLEIYLFLHINHSSFSPPQFSAVHSSAINSVTIFMFSKAVDSEAEGLKRWLFSSTFPSDTCAKGVCSCRSHCQLAVYCQVKPCGCDCPSQLHKIFANVHVSGN